MTAYDGFKIGDYVIADHARFDDFRDVTFKITKLGHNLFKDELIKVQNIATPGGVSTSFYPHELSYEDGTRPAV